MKFPSLLYLADVPVENSLHGSALVYRLLKGYPAENLRILEGNLFASEAARRLANVTYKTFQVGWKRPLQTRFSAWWLAWLGYTAKSRARSIGRLLEGFKPEALLTVTNHISWITAAEFARRRGLPLHLILHDEFIDIASVPTRVKAFLRSTLGQAYRESASRLCVSPFMEREYFRRFAMPGLVLYPSRAADLPEFDAPPERIRNAPAPFTLAYAGSLFNADYLRQLAEVADELRSLDGRLIIYGPHDRSSLAANDFDYPNVVLGGMIPSPELVRRMREEVDLLYLPMPFNPKEVECFGLNFPSKLTDYTATGLPVLIRGPETTSAVRWARSEPGVAEVVCEPSREGLRAVLHRIKRDAELRWVLGARALEVGRKYFSASGAQKVFEAALSRAS